MAVTEIDLTHRDDKQTGIAEELASVHAEASSRNLLLGEFASGKSRLIDLDQEVNSPQSSVSSQPDQSVEA